MGGKIWAATHRLWSLQAASQFTQEWQQHGELQTILVRRCSLQLRGLFTVQASHSIETLPSCLDCHLAACPMDSLCSALSVNYQDIQRLNSPFQMATTSVLAAKVHVWLMVYQLTPAGHFHVTNHFLRLLAVFFFLITINIKARWLKLFWQLKVSYFICLFADDAKIN